jgi:hypothetical protein
VKHLKKLCTSIQKKRVECWHPVQCFFMTMRDRTHILFENFNCELFDHPPYSLNLAPSDYHLFTYEKNWLWSEYLSWWKVPKRGWTHRPQTSLTSIYLWLYSYFVTHWPIFSFFIFYTLGRSPWTGDEPVARPLPAHTGVHKHRINAHRLPCFKCDSNPRPQCLSGRRLFVP